jgi:hypothetical protein
MTRDRLEAELREHAINVRWPLTPDLAERVVARLEDGAGEPERAERRVGTGPRRRAPLVFGRGPGVAAAAILTLLIVGALVAPVRSAMLDVLGIGGPDRIVRVPGPPDTSRPALDVGARTTLAAAQRRLAFAIRLPRALGPPREVRYSDAIAGGAVTLIGPGTALLETEGGIDPVLQKGIGPGAHARPVSVAGAPGYFITGARETAVLDRDGHMIPASRSLARGDALVWQRDGIAFRLETRGGLRRALAIARSVR